MPRKKNTRQHNVTRKVHESSAKNQRFAGGVNPKRKDMYIHSQGRPKPRPPRPRDHGEPYVPDYMQPYQYEDYLDGQGGGTSGGSGNRCECTINYGSFTGECIPSNSNYECAQGCTAFCNMFSNRCHSLLFFGEYTKFPIVQNNKVLILFGLRIRRLYLSYQHQDKVLHLHPEDNHYSLCYPL